jgi:methylaspartate mutase epsilon subunit
VPISSSGFAAFVASCRAQGRLVLQPRMGFATPEHMRAGLQAVKDAAPATAGTLTLDSYTRIGDFAGAARGLWDGQKLNGFPLVAHGPNVTWGLVRGVADEGFAVQIRHGSPRPLRIFETLLAAGLDATEGGPVSYCLPYSRVPLSEAVTEWRRCCELLAERTTADRPGHLETFGGCMLGQLCPPSLLVALSVLEALFFVQHGLASVSLSYAQQTNHAQDEGAVTALRSLAARHLAGVDWHVVIYTYMGVYPRTHAGACELLGDSVRLARATDAERLIVKTPVEGFRIPTIADNVAALRVAASLRDAGGSDPVPSADHHQEILHEASALIDSVLELSDDVGSALVAAFERGQLDVPYCLHPDNANRSRSSIDADGCLRWADRGCMPVARPTSRRGAVTAAELLEMLTHMQRRLDGEGSRRQRRDRRGVSASFRP